jgi:hypothetical protein
MVDASSNAPSRLAIAFLLLLLATVTGAVALTIAGKTPADLFGLFFAEPEDGNWIAVAFDGRRVAPKTYLISIKRGQIVSGYDGCNSWAYLEEKASQNAERMIVTDLKECPNNELARGYWELLAEPKFVLLDNRQLTVWGKQRRGHFRRCKEVISDERCALM